MVYGQPQQQQRSGPGIGTAVAAGGAGLLGGVLLGEALENHEDNDEREAYQDGELLFLYLDLSPSVSFFVRASSLIFPL